MEPLDRTRTALKGSDTGDWKYWNGPERNIKA